MNRNTTFTTAIRLGAGAELTDGRNRYRISDWSPSDRTVYGWHMADDGTQGAYGRLPRNLQEVTSERRS